MTARTKKTNDEPADVVAYDALTLEIERIDGLATLLEEYFNNAGDSAIGLCVIAQTISDKLQIVKDRAEELRQFAVRGAR